MAQHDTYTLKQLDNLGKRIKSLRKAKGYSNYEHFAYQHGLNRAQYGEYENGKNLTFASLLRVCRALDISLIDFFSEGFEVEE